MMPWPRLNTTPVTSSQPPQMIRAARVWSVRRAPGDGQAGDQQDQGGRAAARRSARRTRTLNMRSQPVGPQLPAGRAAAADAARIRCRSGGRSRCSRRSGSRGCCSASRRCTGGRRRASAMTATTHHRLETIRATPASSELPDAGARAWAARRPGRRGRRRARRRTPAASW